MTTSNTAASKVQFVQVNQASYLLVEKNYLTTVTKGLKKLGAAFSTENLKDGHVQVKLINPSERLWKSLNAKYPCHKFSKPKLYVSGGTFYKSTDGYRLGLDQESHASVLNRIRQMGIQFTSITSWNDRLDGRVRIKFINLSQEQIKLLKEEYGGEMGCYVAINPKQPAPKKQAKPAAKQDLWSWGTNGEIPTVSLEQLEAIAASKQATPVEVKPDTDSTPSEQTPHGVDTATEVQPDTERAPSAQTPDTGSTPTKFATKTDFINLGVKQLHGLANELGIDKTIKLKTELAKALAEANHFPQATIQAMKMKK